MFLPPPVRWLKVNNKNKLTGKSRFEVSFTEAIFLVYILISQSQVLNMLDTTHSLPFLPVIFTPFVGVYHNSGSFRPFQFPELASSPEKSSIKSLLPLPGILHLKIYFRFNLENFSPQAG